MSSPLYVFLPDDAPLTLTEVRELVPRGTVLADTGARAAFVVALGGARVTLQPLSADESKEELRLIALKLLSEGRLLAPRVDETLRSMRQVVQVYASSPADPELSADVLAHTLAAERGGSCFDGVDLFSATGSLLATLVRSRSDDELPALEFAEAEVTGIPGPERIAARAVVLCAVALRGLLEVDSRISEPEEVRSQLRELIQRPSIARELERPERALLEAEVGALELGEALAATWRVEGAVVLAWCLGQMELPRHDQQADPFEVADVLGVRPGSPLALVRAPVLRNPNDLVAQAERLVAIHGRIGDYLDDPHPVDFRLHARRYTATSAELKGVPLAERDLAIDGVAIFRADADRVHEVGRIAVERLHAINWVIGQAQRYSDL